jgi:hypothetical protein
MFNSFQQQPVHMSWAMPTSSRLLSILDGASQSTLLRRKSKQQHANELLRLQHRALEFDLHG